MDIIDSRLKQFLSYILLAIFVFSTVGNCLIFLWMQIEVKIEMKNRIASSILEKDLSIFTFNMTDYQDLTYEDDNEFRYKSTMYDVVKIIKNNNGNICINCINGEKETKFIAEFEKQTQTNSSNSAERQQRQPQLKLISYYFLLTNTDFSFAFHKSILLIQNFQPFYIPFLVEIPSPPPKSV